MGLGFGYKQRKSEYCFRPDSKEPYRISRSKIDLFLECPRCFYLDVRFGLPRTSMAPFSLNNAVDELLKRECDALRKKKRPHPVAVESGVKAVPFQHEKTRRMARRTACRRAIP